MDWQRYVEYDPRDLRPAEVDPLEGDASKAEKVLGWKPQTSFKELVAMMVNHDRDLARRERTLVDAGHTLSHSGQD